MGFFDKVKKAFDSKKEDGESQDDRNFKYLDNLIHNGANEVVLDSDIILDDSENYEYSSGIKLDVDDIVINGNGHAIDACKKTRIFICSGRNVTIKNITLKNGYEKYEGGAIYNTGELTIRDSTLSNNMADRASANVAKSAGGAIYNEGELSIVDSTLSNNTSKMEGGAISNDGNLNIINSTFSDNETRYNGGAISNDGKLNIKDSTISNNLAKEASTAIAGGGAIFNRGELIVENSNLHHNGGNTGGAIRNAKYAKVFNCEISNNYAPRNIIANSDFLEIRNTILSNNSSKNIIENRKFNLSFFSCKFIGNAAEESVIYNSGKFLTVSDSILKDNLMHNPNAKNIINKTSLTLINSKIPDDGKSISNEGSILLKKSSKNFENKIEGSGDVEIYGGNIPDRNRFDFGYLDKKIHESKSKKIILDQDICFEKYESDFYEGGIELDIDDLIIDGGGHTVDGASRSRIFLITGNNITLKNIIFKNGFMHRNYDNLRNCNGGAIRINNINLAIKNCEFINNSTEMHGGAIYNAGMLDISGSDFSDNSSEMGGAICNDGELNVNDSTLSRNSVNGKAQGHYKGGAIGNSGLLNICNSTFSGNTVEGGFENISNYYGGAIYSNGELNILKSLFKCNVVKKDGGAIYNDGGELTIAKSEFNNNTAQGRLCGGGAIHNNEGNSTITESAFTKNTAEEGSGGAVENSSGVLSIEKSTLTENGVKYNGGAIDNDGGKLTVTESTLDKNTTENGGGAIDNDGGELTVTGSAFAENTGHHGGAINDNGKTTITQSAFSRNTVEYYGGAIRNIGELTIKGSTLTGNAAKKGSGGAIHNRGELTITESELNDNTTKKGGGAIHNNESELTITESTLTGNTAEEGTGAAIYNEEEKSFNIKNCKLENNKPNDIG